MKVLELEREMLRISVETFTHQNGHKSHVHKLHFRFHIKKIQHDKCVISRLTMENFSIKTHQRINKSYTPADYEEKYSSMKTS